MPHKWSGTNDSIRIAQEHCDALRTALIDMATTTLRVSTGLLEQREALDAQELLTALVAVRALVRRIDIEVTNVAIAASNVLIAQLATRKGGKTTGEDHERHEHRPDRRGPTSAAVNAGRSRQRN